MAVDNDPTNIVCLAQYALFLEQKLERQDQEEGGVEGHPLGKPGNTGKEEQIVVRSLKQTKERDASIQVIAQLHVRACKQGPREIALHVTASRFLRKCHLWRKYDTLLFALINATLLPLPKAKESSATNAENPEEREEEEEEEDEEEEEGDAVTITVNGQVKLLKDVTDEDQANMTEQERETWAELIGIDDY